MNYSEIFSGQRLARWPLAFAVLLATTKLPASAAEPMRAAQAACGTHAADAASADPASLVRALYEIVSGPAHGTKDWARLQRLHAPGALITPTQHKSDRTFAAAPQPLESFIALNERLFANRGFYENEIFQRVERFGHIAHVWSGYETREQRGGTVQARGINSFQLVNDGGRWCVLSATWDVDTPAHPIPRADASQAIR